MVMLDNKEVILNNKTFDVAQAKKHFSELLGRVAYGGERIIISKRGKPLAVLVPPSELSPEDHLCKAKGWLENDDPFFDIMDQIVSDRAAHTPRILKSKKG
jgi:prevent-host-death family protein